MANDCKGLFDVLNKGVKDETNASIVNALEENFKDNISYFEIYKNFDYETTYDALIVDYQDWHERVSRKKIIMYPYQEIDTGDYVHWFYGDSLSDWLVISTDKQYNYKISGEMKRTNADLKWYNQYGEVVSWRCVYDSKMNETSFDFARYMINANGDVMIFVQSNSDTQLIEIDDRFLFNGTAFKVRQVNKFLGDNLLVLDMQYDALQEDDDIVNNIACTTNRVYTISIDQDNFEGYVSDTGQLTATVKYNGNLSSETVEWISSDPAIVSIDANGNYVMTGNGTATITARMYNNNTVSDTATITVATSPVVIEQNIITPDVNEILQGDTVSYSVYKYENNTQQADTFTITASGVPSTYYTLSILDGNNFTITNVLRYDASELTILCTNDVDSTTATIEITLKGAW